MFSDSKVEGDIISNLIKKIENVAPKNEAEWAELCWMYPYINIKTLLPDDKSLEKAFGEKLQYIADNDCLLPSGMDIFMEGYYELRQSAVRNRLHDFLLNFFAELTQYIPQRNWQALEAAAQSKLHLLIKERRTLGSDWKFIDISLICAKLRIYKACVDKIIEHESVLPVNYYKEGYQSERGLHGEVTNLEESEITAIKNYELSFKHGYALAGLALSYCYFKQAGRLLRQHRQHNLMRELFKDDKYADVKGDQRQLIREAQRKIKEYFDSYIQTKKACASDVLTLYFDMNTDEASSLNFPEANIDNCEMYGWYRKLLVSKDIWQPFSEKDPCAKVCVGLSIQHDQPEQAVRLFEEAAKSDNAWAWYCLGVLPSSIAKKAEYCKKSAELGCKNGQFVFATFCEFGEGVSVDQELAQKFYLQSAEQGFAKAQLRYGSLLIKHKKFKEAKQYVYLAAMQGDMLAQGILAGIYQIDADNARAFYWYCMSAMQDYFPSANMLGCLYQYGIGCDKNEKLAFYWHYIAACNNYLYGVYSLALAYQSGMGINKDEKKAVGLYELVAKEGWGIAYYQLGKIKLANAKSITDLTQVAKYLEKAFEKKVVSSQEMLADLYFDMAEYYAVGKIENSVVVPHVWETSKDAVQLWQPNYSLAFEYYRRSARLGSQDALTKLVELKKASDIVKKNKATPIIKKPKIAKAKGKKAVQPDLGKAHIKMLLAKEQQELAPIFEQLKKQALEQATNKAITAAIREEKRQQQNRINSQALRFSKIQALIRQAEEHLFKKEVSAAIKLLKQAAEYGSKLAQQRLKIILRKDDEQIAKDEKEAALWEARLKEQKEIESATIVEFLSKDKKTETGIIESIAIPDLIIEADIPEMVYLPVASKTDNSTAVMSCAKQSMSPSIAPVKTQTTMFELAGEKKVHFSSLLSAEEIPLSLFQRFMEMVSAVKSGEIDGLKSMLTEAIKNGIQVSLRASAFLALIQWIRNTPFSPVINDLDFVFAMPENMYRQKVLSQTPDAKNLPIFLHDKHFKDKVDIVYHVLGGKYLNNDILHLTSLCIPIVLNNGKLVLKLNQQDQHVKTFIAHVSQNPPLVESHLPPEKIAFIYRRSNFYPYLFKYYLKFNGSGIGRQLMHILFDRNFHAEYVRRKYFSNILGFYREIVELIRVDYFAHPKLSNLVQSFIKEICYQLLGAERLDFLQKTIAILQDNYTACNKTMSENVRNFPGYWLLFNLREIFRHYFPSFDANYWNFLTTLYQPTISKETLSVSVAQLEQMIISHHRLSQEKEFMEFHHKVAMKFFEQQRVQQQNANVAPGIRPVAAGPINANAFFAGARSSSQYHDHVAAPAAKR